MLKDWNSHYKTHFDNVIDFLHKLKTEIIDKREKYDELEKATQELLLKIEDRKNKSRERENVECLYLCTSIFHHLMLCNTVFQNRVQ
jgi:hypothetical protein